MTEVISSLPNLWGSLTHPFEWICSGMHDAGTLSWTGWDHSVGIPVSTPLVHSVFLSGFSILSLLSSFQLVFNLNTPCLTGSNRLDENQSVHSQRSAPFRIPHIQYIWSYTWIVTVRWGYVFCPSDQLASSRIWVHDGCDDRWKVNWSFYSNWCSSILADAETLRTGWNYWMETHIPLSMIPRRDEEWECCRKVSTSSEIVDSLSVAYYPAIERQRGVCRGL